MDQERRDIYTGLKDKELKRKGFFIGESKFVVERMILSGWDLESVVCTPAQFAFFEGLVNGKCPVEVLSREEISSLVGYSFHRGVLAAGKRPAWPGVSSFLTGLEGSSLVLVCPAIADPSNIGALVRSCRAFGVQGILLGKTCGDPLSRIAIRASMGNVFYIPITYMEDEKETARLLKKRGFTLTGTVLDEEALQLNRVKNSRPEALIMGHEAQGLSDQWKSCCDRLVTIPMADTTDSLNVAAAGALFLYHLSQRGVK